ncbi:3-deoxy-manno-octulosonate cytidylyltransferase [Lewinellaceae bacterium SD302]|nr:3-deoxy-manno-octulosonate cytidylyltransferase [Lewinellaceae bacterium SD302]
MKIAAIIPARYASSRFPGKPLADLGGQSLVQRVYRGVESTGLVDRVIVATDDQRIFDHVTSFGGEVSMTATDHPSGTDRVAEVAAQVDDCELIVNVQGDEPFVNRKQLAALIGCFDQPATQIATLARPIDEEADLFSPNVVKVVRGQANQALYFSRQAIPFLRDLPLGRWLEAKAHLQHLGLYAFRRPTLLEITNLPAAELEERESLEQLRWLAAGYRISVALTTERSIGIDTPGDLLAALDHFS